jgi:hypothetical protein
MPLFFLPSKTKIMNQTSQTESKLPVLTLLNATEEPINQPIQFSTDSQFIKANTEEVSFNHLLHECIVPVFAKDNETTLSHIDFIEAANDVIHHIFRRESINHPSVRVSHPIKGRTPEAIRKPVIELLDSEKTLYYERMAFVFELPSIQYTIKGNPLSLVVGGVRAYNTENLYSRKTEERFKVFIGFQNKVCTNMCVSTDGFKAELRARTIQELGEGIFDMVKNFNIERQLRMLEVMPNYFISEAQFASLIGRMRMYQIMPPELRKGIPPLMISDSQINTVVKDYYFDKNFSRNADGGIDIWSLYNLFTEANKSSYIDSFLDRSANATLLCKHFTDILNTNEQSWYLS